MRFSCSSIALQIQNLVYSNLQKPLNMFLLAFPGGAEWLILIIGLTYLAGLIMLVGTVWKRPDLQENTKLLWSMFFFLAPVIALIIYALFGRQNRGIQK
jgi:uncharacterized membrane protein YecN with MAPEG domain